MIVDAGPLLAYHSARDSQHAACVELLETHPGRLIVPTLVVTEVAHFLAPAHGTPEDELSFLADLADGALIVEPVHPADWTRIAELAWQYRDLPLGTVDASVVAAAERLDITTIATLDRRDFNVLEPAHAERFELLP